MKRNAVCFEGGEKRTRKQSKGKKHERKIERYSTLDNWQQGYFLSSLLLKAVNKHIEYSRRKNKILCVRGVVPLFREGIWIKHLKNLFNPNPWPNRLDVVRKKISSTFFSLKNMVTVKYYNSQVILSALSVLHTIYIPCPVYATVSCQ